MTLIWCAKYLPLRNGWPKTASYTEKKRDTKQKERKGMVDGSKELENVVQQSESK